MPIYHLPPASDYRVTKICDLCRVEIPNQKYGAIIAARRDGKDRCRTCAQKESAKLVGKKSGETKRRLAATKTHNLAVSFPEIAAEWHPILNGKLRPSDFAPRSGWRAWWLCGTCRHEWSATIAQRTFSDTWCPICCASKGEREVRKALDSFGAVYTEQVSFDGLLGLGNGNLLFDFGVLRGGKIVALIEYDGIHHFRPIQMNNSDSVKQFQIRREHDRRKDEWCKKAGIPLLRICYKDFSDVSVLVFNFLNGVKAVG